MKPFKKILVPVDFSPHSDEAIRYAGDLSRRFEASVGLLHVYQPLGYALPEGYVFCTPTQMADLLSEIDRFLEVAKKDAETAGCLRVETTMLQGVASTEIASHAREGGYDLIVMGTHGRTGIKHALLGSVAEKVVRTAPCPVLTVRVFEQPAE